MRIEALKFRNKDNQDIIICIELLTDYFKKCEWRISDIIYKTSRQRKYTSLNDTFRDDYKYRQLDPQAREAFTMSRYIEFVGKEKISEAVIAAWESIKPDIDSICVGNI